ncbi:MAG: glycerol-3-phosphate 1-O-acyltransferase PlsY [Tissierellia bacterium]|nr:glycerol-3-phosphate 1-O-acyltransferase PlsY [Tissierellia bacterium]
MYYIFSYLLGSVSFSYILVKVLKGVDIREQGSKNAGGTNVLRNHGWPIALVVGILDVLKGTLATYIGFKMGMDKALLGLVCVVLGHNFPIYFGFKGGKGIATSFGGLIFLFPMWTAIVAGICILIVYLTKYVSLGSIVFMTVLPILLISIKDLSVLNKICIGGLGILAIIRHRSNIQRLIHGEENKISSGGKK